MKEHFIYVIYRDGKPMESNKRGIKRNCFDRIGSAKSIVTSLCNDEAYEKTRHSYGEEHDKSFEEARQHYHIVKYGAIEEAR